MKIKLLLLFIFFALVPFTKRTVLGQSAQMKNDLLRATLKPQGKFMKDSVKIGEIVHYALSIHHLPDIQLVFPDTTYNFTPFEIQRRQYFPTHTHNGISTDSVVYYLSTFEIDQVQYLHLPIFVVTPTDSFPIYPEKDSVYLNELIPPNNANESLKTNTTLQTTKAAFNYPYWIVAIIILLGFIGILFGLFGKPLRKKYKLYRLKSKYNEFTHDFDKIIQAFQNTAKQLLIEQALIVWKKYIEGLEGKPFTSYTSKEITLILPDKKLSIALKEIDSVIYGKSVSSEIIHSLSYLKDIALLRYTHKQATIKNVSKA